MKQEHGETSQARANESNDERTIALVTEKGDHNVSFKPFKLIEKLCVMHLFTFSQFAFSHRW